MWSPATSVAAYAYYWSYMRPEPRDTDDRCPDSWDAGWSARQCGSPLSDNPFRGELGDWWDRGWLEGEINGDLWEFGGQQTDPDDAGH